MDLYGAKLRKIERRKFRSMSTDALYMFFKDCAYKMHSPARRWRGEPLTAVERERIQRTWWVLRCQSRAELLRRKGVNWKDRETNDPPWWRYPAPQEGEK